MKEAEEAVAAAKKGQGVVAFQRDVAPAGEAQLKAVEATVDEAVKNGTTAGAMGVGALAYTEAQMKADAQAAAAEAAAATAKKQVEEQPWLKADENDQELPPLSDEERESSERTAKQTAGMTAEKLKRVDLNLDAQTPAYVPPLAPEPSRRRRLRSPQPSRQRLCRMRRSARVSKLLMPSSIWRNLSLVWTPKRRRSSCSRR